MKHLYISFFVVLLSGPAQSQADRDSLLHILEDVTKPDTQRIAAGHSLVWRVYLQKSPDTARLYAKRTLELAQNLGRSKQISRAYNSIGVTYHIQGEFKEAVSYYQLSLDVDKERARSTPGDADAVSGIAASYSNIAVLHQQSGNMPLAIHNYEAALHLLDSLEMAGADVNMKIADAQNNIGLANESQGNTVEALSWFQKVKGRYGNGEAAAGLANTLTNIGNALMRLSKEEGNTVNVRDSLAQEASQNLIESLRIRRKIGDRNGEANSLNNIGANIQQRAIRSQDADVSLGLLKESEEYYREAIAIVEETQAKGEMAGILANLAENLLLQKRDNEAAELARSAFDIGEQLGHAEYMMRASEKLYQAYKRMGRPVDALAMYELHMALQDSVRNEENTRLLMRQQYAYDYAKRETELMFEQEKKDAITAEQLKRRNQQRNAFMGGFVLMLGLAGVSYRSYRVKRRDNEIISREKARSESLLLNILPAEVAEELKAKGSAEAVQIDQVTVLFTDFKGFTVMSELVSPKELVADLHACFSEFDRICEKYGIEKIKTIGDAYMAAGGLPSPNATHAQDVVRAALEMAEVVEKGKTNKIRDGLPFFEIRIGIHTGPVVAGIVGVKKFQYDIWGDTVNTASRMESSGAVGKVNISQSTYELLKDDSDFIFESRGKIAAKGKGEILMYFVA
jgi:adenylate cyclase